MGSANMKDVKRRIKSVESTMQITKAMELVASSKLRRAKDKADKARPYFNTFYETMCNISADNRDFSSAYTRQRIVKKSLLIVIAGDRGLAGGYNANILKLAVNSANEKNGNVKILAIGKKSVEFFQKRGYDMLGSFLGIAESLRINSAKELTEIIVNGYLKNEYDEVELIYTTFASALSQVSKCVKILPFVPAKRTNGKSGQMTTYDPSPETVFNSIVPKYISGLLYGAIIDAYASEQAARRIAMESASDNASDMIDNLSLIYNRARQAAITQEISEIVSGSQA